MACGSEYAENLENLCKLFSLHQMVQFPIEKVDCAAGSSSGDNYMSIVKRVRVISAGNSNKNDAAQELMSFIIKRQISSLSRRQLFRCDEAFCNEINAYKHMVPLLMHYTTVEFFPQCYFAGKDDMGDDIIVLEDLQMLGYRMQNRLTSLELSFCQLVMKQLANLHAASIAAKQLNNKIFREKCKHIKDIVYSKEAEEFYKNILDGSVQESLSSLRASNMDGRLSEPIRLIEKLQTKLFCKIQNGIVNSQESINVMCHGDLWVNNIMFASGNAADLVFLPCDVRFLDLQAMRYTSPVFDILHFIYTSTKRELRDAYTKTLLETYSLALTHNLELQFVHAQSQLSRLLDIYSLRNITNEYYKHVLYGLAISIWILPAVTFDPNNIPNLDAISEMNTSAKDIKCTQKLTAEYHSRVKDLALEFYHNGYLNACLHED